MLFLHPEYFWAMWAVPLVIGALLWAAWQRKRAARRFGEETLLARLSTSVSLRKRRWRGAMLVAAVALLAFALAGPRYGTRVREVRREGVDLVIALDVSASMLAEDVAPSRLERAKNEVKKLLAELSGDRVGLVLFAGDAFVQCPLTTDYGAVRLFLDVAEPSLIPTPGTDFGAALAAARQAFSAQDPDGQEEKRTRVLLFISDGENHVGDMRTATDEARKANIHIFAAGVGGDEGAPIPLRERGRTTYKTDREGRTVLTRLEAASLQRLAEGGAYYRITRTSSSLPELIPALGTMEKTAFASDEFEDYEEQFGWPLALGLLLLVAERFVGDRRRAPRALR